MRVPVRSLVRSPSLAAWIAALLTAWVARPRAAPFGAPVLWVADRGGGALIGLDADLFSVARLAWPTPVAIEPAASPDAEDRFWVVSAPRGDPLGGHRLSLVAPAGAGELCAIELGHWLDLEAAPDGGALFLEGGHEGHGSLRWLARVDPRGVRRVLAAPPGALRLAAGPAGLLVGTEAGELWHFDGAWARGPRLPGVVRDLAWDDVGGGWWVLASAGDALAVLRLGPRLEICARASLGGAREGVLLVARETTWVAAADVARAWCVDPSGTVLCEVPLYQRGVAAGVVGPCGELVFALPGALVRKSAEGAPLPGQGGFEHLVDVASADPPWDPRGPWAGRGAGAARGHGGPASMAPWSFRP